MSLRQPNKRLCISRVTDIQQSKWQCFIISHTVMHTNTHTHKNTKDLLMAARIQLLIIKSSWTWLKEGAHSQVQSPHEAGHSICVAGTVCVRLWHWYLLIKQPNASMHSARQKVTPNRSTSDRWARTERGMLKLTTKDLLVPLCPLLLYNTVILKVQEKRKQYSGVHLIK